MQNRLDPGIYSIKCERVVFERPGLSSEDCKTEDEFVVTCAVPRTGTVVDPEAPLLKIQTLGEALDSEAKRLNVWAAKISEWAYASLDLVDCVG